MAIASTLRHELGHVEGSGSARSNRGSLRGCRGSLRGQAVLTPSLDGGLLFSEQSVPGHLLLVPNPGVLVGRLLAEKISGMEIRSQKVWEEIMATADGSEPEDRKTNKRRRRDRKEEPKSLDTSELREIMRKTA
jgi:hypothetical protein